MSIARLPCHLTFQSGLGSIVVPIKAVAPAHGALIIAELPYSVLDRVSALCMQARGDKYRLLQPRYASDICSNQ